MSISFPPDDGPPIPDGPPSFAAQLEATDRPPTNEISTEAEEEVSSKPPSQATILTEIVCDDPDVVLWHDHDGTAWATIPAGDHDEHHRVRAKPFRTWLRQRFYHDQGKSPSSQAVQDAVENLCGIAEFDGVERPVHLRVAEHDDALYLDLADARWRAVQVTAAGWTVVDNPPVKFQRRGGMLPLPEPVRGGDLADLRRFVNVSDEDWLLVLGWLLAAVRAAGPYPVLNLLGMQGTGKSTTARVLRRLLDPNTADVRRAPRDERDLILAANNGQVVSLENLSWLPAWLSDALAALATGSGFATRTLYENDEEMIFAACRPIILNGIEEVAVRPDLLDRSILVNHPEIRDRDRQTEAEFWRRFDQDRPGILGALLDVVAAGLAHQDTVRPSSLPRMADFATWVCACAPALGVTMDDFLDRYAGNRTSAHDLALEASPVGIPIRDLVLDAGTWEGTAGELHQALTTEERRRSKTWPSSGQKMAGALKRITPALRDAGIEVEYLSTVRPRRWRLGTQTSDASDTGDETQVRGGDDPVTLLSPDEIGDGTSDSPPDEGNGVADPPSSRSVTCVTSVTPAATQSNDGSDGGDPDHRCEGCGIPIDRPYWCDDCAREPVDQEGAA